MEEEEEPELLRSRGVRISWSSLASLLTAPD